MRVALLLVLLLLAAPAEAADLVHRVDLKDGTSLRVVVLEETDAGLRVRTLEGEVLDLLYPDVLRLRVTDELAPRLPSPDEERAREEREAEALRAIEEAELAVERARWLKQHGPRAMVERWRQPARGVGLGLGIPMFTVGVAFIGYATPVGISDGAGSGVYQGLRNTGLLLMGAFIPSGIVGSLLAHESLAQAGGDFGADIGVGIAGGITYSVGMGLMMTALTWPEWDDPWSTAPFGFASIPSLITGFVLLCADIDNTTRAAYDLARVRARKQAVRAVPWVAPGAQGTTFGVAGTF